MTSSFAMLVALLTSKSSSVLISTKKSIKESWYIRKQFISGAKLGHYNDIVSMPGYKK